MLRTPICAPRARDHRTAAVPLPPRSSGRPLDRATRQWIEPRLQHDFSGVRIHTDALAADAASALGALAFTHGRDVVFAAGRYAPHTRGGRRLLAHELAHVVQQERRSPTPGEPLRVSEPGDAGERAADAAAALADGPVAPSAALRSVRGALLSSAPAAPTLQRAVTTWAGEWDTTRYRNNAPAGVPEGVEIHLKFDPGPEVNATSIGMVQTANSVLNGAVVAANPTVATRSIPAGEAGEGIHIDQYATDRSPLYAVEGAGAGDRTLTATRPDRFFGTHGRRFTDDTGTLQVRPATLRDRTRIPGRGANSSQIFETTALALSGEQQGTYYGSVRWGWRTDAANNFRRLPLTRVSNDVPSFRFNRAAQIWNAGTTSAGVANLRLPTASGRFVNLADTPFVSDPADPAGSELARLGQNVRVELTDWGVGRDFNRGRARAERWWRITVVEGPEIGRVGWVQAGRLSARRVAEAAPAP